MKKKDEELDSTNGKLSDTSEQLEKEKAMHTETL